MSPARIGVLGGTFDPVHVGHLTAAVNVLYSLGLDRVLLVVANIPWQKAELRPVSPAEDRLAMVEAAVADIPRLDASRLEIDRGGPSYTADTVEELNRLHPGAGLYLVVGTDVVEQLPTWERVNEVRDRVVLAVVTRPGARPAPAPGWRVEHVEIPALDISSTDLRARAADGRPLDFLVPAAAVHVIRQRGLYAWRTDEERSVT